MPLLTLAHTHLAYGDAALLDDASFVLQPGERVGLIGRNGSGKSSLLKLLAGLEAPDAGELQRTQGLRCAYVPQEGGLDAAATVFDAVADGLADARALRLRYEQHASGDDLAALHAQLDTLDAWHWEQRVATTLSQLQLDGTRRVGELSGGGAKRVALARALVAAPEVLLLDEPTNHLDLDAIAWLEGWLQGFGGAVVVVSHDRAFLDAVATTIVELDRGRLRAYPGNFAAFERRRDEELAAEAAAAARADKLLAQEEAWVRQGVEARRTRSVARVQRLQGLRAQRAQRREALGQALLAIDAGMRSGRIVAELEDAGFAWAPGAPPVVQGFSATFLRGDKIGLIGPNGAGKTTLLRLILGELEPTAGRVRRGTNLQVAYFDQQRSRLDPDATLAESVSPGSDWVEIGGRRRHVIAYLGDFLFPPQRARAPVRTLSGGERNRLLLARLFALPANLLVLDEPTNDLDIDTLELLEELLQAYAGTVFLVSHDRRFLDNVVTSTIAWEGDDSPGLWREYEGGYEEWRVQHERARALREARAVQPAPVVEKEKPAPPPAAASKPRKLSYKEQRELDELPGRIETLEAEQKALNELLADPSGYVKDAQRMTEAHKRVAEIDELLMSALERWEELGSR
ncbi:MAG: ATP-binding cassette domain-containing protein [Rubrivivax sp.]|nr:ATP-binding cassette domain-containing protein [Rubrivivax sp.]